MADTSEDQVVSTAYHAAIGTGGVPERIAFIFAFLLDVKDEHLVVNQSNCILVPLDLQRGALSPAVHILERGTFTQIQAGEQRHDPNYQPLGSGSNTRALGVSVGKSSWLSIVRTRLTSGVVRASEHRKS